MHNFDRSVIETKNLVKTGIISASEFARLGLSDLHWALARKKKLRSGNVKKGEIFQFDFGKNSVPEMSYEHRGLVLGHTKSLLYVLPIFSYKEAVHKKDLYDASTPKGKRGTLYFLSAADHGFLTHDSVLKLDDMRSVSVKRILYKQPNGKMDISSDEFKELESQVFARYFPEYYFEMLSLREKNAQLKNEIATLRSKFSLEELQATDASLQQQHEATD